MHATQSDTILSSSEPGIQLSALHTHQEAQSSSYAEQHHEAAIRSPFCLSGLKIDQESPISVIAKLYTDAKTSQEKQACLRYLIHYQHYNAEFTRLENQQLGYPEPLCASQELPGYFRTEYNRRLELVKPYVHFYMKDQELFKILPNGKKIIDLINLTTRSAIPVLKFFLKEHHIIELQDIKESESLTGGGQGSPNKIFVIRLEPNDFSKTALKIIEERLQKIDKKQKPGTLRMQNPNLHFLFLIEVDGIDCIIMWGAKWSKPKKDNTLEFLRIDSREFFGQTVFSILGETGAVPDRLAVNELITHQLGKQKSVFASDLEKIGINYTLPNDNNFENGDQKKIWTDHINLISNYQFEDDVGCLVYRDAILEWQSIFFDQNPSIEVFALPLLCSQVKPWLFEESTIVQWSKAYQNLCEIIMLCLDYFRELPCQIDLQSIALKILDPENQFKNRSFGLYSYSMISITDIFCLILERNEFKKQKILIACVNQNYFETIDLIEKMATEDRISVLKANALHEIKVECNVCVLVVDIHPNNATRDQLFENDILNWIHGKLQENLTQKIILILDITLNNLSDHIFQNILGGLHRFIINGQLELFGVQSLAKLVQMGADNFSGGSCFYLGESNDETHSKIFQTSISRKAVFFGFLAKNFQKITTGYFSIVRQNTDWMYQKLRQRFADVKKVIWMQAEDGKKRSGFCAVNITTNVDENTVYVAINFKPFFEKIKKSDEEKEGLVKKFQELILDLVGLRVLPITGRQSFGFSLSNMSLAKHAIRFSIGVENQNFLEQYADIVTDFSWALSKYVANDYNLFEIEYFSESIKKVYKILRDGEMLDPMFRVTLFEVGYDECLDEIRNDVGNAKISFKEHRLSLRSERNSMENEKVIEEVFEPNIGIASDLLISHGNNYWTHGDLFQLFFYLVAIGSKSVYVINDAIGGFFEVGSLFRNKSQADDEKARVAIQFEPEFELKSADGSKYSSNNVFVNFSELGTIPVALSKLNKEQKNKVFTQCAQFYLKVSPYQRKLGCILLEFSERKPYLDYWKHFQTLWGQGGFSHIVHYLNELDVSQLPLLEDQSWRQHAETPLECVSKILNQLGRYIIMTLTEENRDQFFEIKVQKFQEQIVEGMFEGLCKNALLGVELRSETAITISQMFSQDKCSVFIKFNAFERWIQEDLEKYMINNPDKIKCLKSYFIAISPIIKHCINSSWLCDTKFSLKFRSISEKLLCFPGLGSHIRCLELQIPMFISTCEWKHKEKITRYLELYVRYPLPEDIKQAVLVQIRKKQKYLLSEWIKSPGFYYHPLDEIEIRITSAYDDFILVASDRKKAREFFEGTECKSILLRLFHENSEDLVDCVRRWMIMTQDDELFFRVSGFGNTVSLLPILKRELHFTYKVKNEIDSRIQHEHDKKFGLIPQVCEGMGQRCLL